MSEVVSPLVSLVIKPFSFSKLVFLLGLRTTLIILYTWKEIIRAAILLHLNIFSKFILWTIAFISLPFQLLTAIHREKQLEKQMHDTQLGLEAVLWDLREFEDRYQKILNEHKMLEMMLSELVDEHEKTLDKLEQVEDKLENLKMENAGLREMGGKDLQDLKNLANIRKGQDLKTGDILRVVSGRHPLKSDHTSTAECVQNLFMHEDESDTDAICLDRLLNVSNRLTCDSLDVLQNVEHRMALDRQREIALKRSLFSSILSFSVGIIIWEAKDPCMPLVMALFTVVGMSLISVVQFFSTIRNKPASDAVALLSLNWFILGMLTYPTLPIVARMLAPMAMTTMAWIIRSLGFSPNS